MHRSKSLPLAFAVTTLGALFAAPVIAAPSPAPSASPTPAPVSDPCTSLSSLVSRPSTSTSSCSVKKNDVLIESGYTNTTTSGTGAQSAILFPQANVRIGVGDNLEIDLNPGSYERTSTIPKTSGSTDTGLGAHYEFGYTSKVTYAVNAVYTTNSGSPAFSGNGDGLTFNLDGALILTPALSAFGTFGYDALSEGTVSVPGRYHFFAPSLGLSLSLPMGFAAYVEGFGDTSSGIGQAGRYGFDGGLQKDVGSRLQLDANLYDFPGALNGSHQHSIGFGAGYLVGP